MSAEFPFIDTTKQDTPQSLPIFKEYAWDFDENHFVYDGNGNMILLEGNEAIKVWLYKMVMTQRNRFLAYTPRYGFEGKELIGKVIGVKERRSELRRQLVEAVLVNPYIKSIENISFVESDNGRNLEVVIDLTSVYGKMTL